MGTRWPARACHRESMACHGLRLAPSSSARLAVPRSGCAALAARVRTRPRPHLAQALTQSDTTASVALPPVSDPASLPNAAPLWACAHRRIVPPLTSSRTHPSAVLMILAMRGRSNHASLSARHFISTRDSIVSLIALCQLFEWPLSVRHAGGPVQRPGALALGDSRATRSPNQASFRDIHKVCSGRGTPPHA